MRIFDLEGSAAGQRSGHRVAVLGTCRVFGPFEELVERGRAVRVWDDGAATHTLAETRQLIRYTRGEFDLPRLVRSFVFQPDEKPTRTKLDTSILDAVDTFFVEISEIRHISYSPYVFNVNRFHENLISKHGQQLLDWYRAFSVGTVDDAIIDSAMAKLADLDLEDKIWIESLLRHSRRIFSGDTDVSAAILDDIIFNPDKQWVLVPLFVVPGIGGSQMGDRSKGIDLAGRLGKERNLTVFDPTELLHKHGVKKALAREGRDIYHYEANFMNIVADGLLESAGLVAQPSEAVNSAAARINEALVDLHRSRLSLGTNESGLYAYYENLLNRKSIAGPAIAKLANIIVNRLPKFDAYHVLRAGLGELAFVLSSLGLQTAGFDPNPARFEAMKAGLEQLGASEPLIAQCLTIQNTAVPDTPPADRILGVAHHLIGYPLEQQDRILAELTRYSALLIDLSSFLFSRRSTQEQDQLLDRLEALGFGNVYRVSEEYVVCAKSDIPLSPP